MEQILNNIRIARVSTVPFFIVTQLKSQLEALTESGAEVTIVASNDDLSDNLTLINKCSFKPVSIPRQIHLITDFMALIKLWNLFRKEQFSIVHSTTPKAGLLCSIAAKLAGVPICIHTYTGQPWVTMSGIKKYIAKFSDKLIARLNIGCYTDSVSQKDFLIQQKIIQPNKLKVIGSGSLAGVSLSRFSQTNFTDAERKQLKHSLGIDDSKQVLLFIGRITKEKGVFELIDAMHQLLKKTADIVLLIVGPFEQQNEQSIREYAQKLCANQVIFTGFDAKPERFMAISDLLCLPSYREGFGTVVIEAAAMGIPVVATKIYGLVDAVIDGVTGVLVEPQNSIQLAQALEALLSNKQLRQKMGEQAKLRAEKDFDSRYCNQLLINEYKMLLMSSSK